MNDNHQRHLLATFSRIDNLLSEAGHILVAANSASPLTEYMQDASSSQRKVIGEHIRNLREMMERIITDMNLPRHIPTTGALWAVRTHLMFAQFAVNEMEPQRMMSYGALSDADIKAIDSIVTELNAALARLMSSLHQD